MIHADRTSRVVMVHQRVQPGVLISLSQHRGRTIALGTREFWARERVHLERIPYTDAAPSPDRYYVYVENALHASAEDKARLRRFTRVVEGVTIRAWGGAVTETRLVELLNEAQPLFATPPAPPPR